MTYSRKYSFLLFIFLITLHRAPGVMAEDIPIPEITAQNADAFLVEAIAKIDDLKEDIGHKATSSKTDKISFFASSFFFASAISGSLITEFFYKSKFFKPVDSAASGLNKIGSSFQKLRDVSTQWLTASVGIQTSTSITDRKIFTIHKRDFNNFLLALNELRTELFSALIEFRSAENKRISRAKLNREIFKNRPSYQSVYSSCSADPWTYKTNTILSIYSESLWDYFNFITLTPATINDQINSKYVSPTLSNYLSQETLYGALQECFQSSGGGFAFKGLVDEVDLFILQLRGADATSKWIAFSTIAGAAHTAFLLSKLEWVNQISAFLSKMPWLIVKAVFATKLAMSAYALIQLKNEYDEIYHNDGIKRQSATDIQKKAKSIYFRNIILSHIAELTPYLENYNLDTTEKARIEKQLSEWNILLAKFPPLETTQASPTQAPL